MSRFNKKDWIYYGWWVQTPLSSFWSVWYKSKALKELFPHYTFDQLLFFDGHTWGSLRDVQFYHRLVDKNYKKETLSDLVADLNTIGSRYKRDYLRLKRTAPQKLESALKELFSQTLNIYGLWWFVLAFADEAQNYILKHDLYQSEEELSRAIDLLKKTTWLEQQAKDVGRLARRARRLGLKLNTLTLKKLKTNGELYDAVLAHVKKFKWYGTHHWVGSPYTIQKFIEQVRDEPSIRKIRKGKLQNHASKPILSLMATLSFWRTHYAELVSKVVLDFRPLLVEYARKLNLTYEGLLQLSFEEVGESFDSPGFKMPTNFAKRRSGWGSYVVRGDKQVIVVGAELKSCIDHLLPKTPNADFVKGVVASSGGMVRSPAKVVISPSDFKKFKKGNILVAPETTPDFVPLMKIASAIVTDRGGVTSHAAIVSRELGVPCVIGTRIATQIFKDDDVLEVDANKGVVRKISKQQKSSFLSII